MTQTTEMPKFGISVGSVVSVRYPQGFRKEDPSYLPGKHRKDTMKHATIRRWRTDRSGARRARLAYVICPWCGSAHWLVPADVVYCPRRPARFALVAPNLPGPRRTA